MSVLDCQRRVSSQEFTEWRAWLALRDAEREADALKADARHADMMALLANIHRDEKKRPRPFTLDDFMPQWVSAAKPPPSDDVLLAKVKALNAAFGGRVT